ncbi:hypothetical protein J5U23_01364 [Saccharolobus shibatae B12]|uniref:Uncharacterized protein n=1 Tax=Saccharolobus shibatae (strain ATCC 51178 / DSM 5389 / JCM 8931 / NBRC 15437 / B12) TaxID=523848 RepID=A0A8F5BNL6_SACSH|nr:hypothetical protein J5U23_01364 [Saccharolobus shibatae B12]
MNALVSFIFPTLLLLSFLHFPICSSRFPLALSLEEFFGEKYYGGIE